MAIVWPCPLAVDAYAAAGRDVGFPRPACPSCAGRLVSWSGYRRYVREAGRCRKIFVPRLRCTRCGVSHALLPAFTLAWRLDVAETIIRRPWSRPDPLRSRPQANSGTRRLLLISRFRASRVLRGADFKEGTGRFRDDRKQLQSHITLRRVTGTSPERRAHFGFLPAPRSRPRQNRPENTADTIIPGTAAQPGEEKASMARHRGHPTQDQLNDHTGLHTPRSLRLCRSASTACTATTTA